MLRLTRAEQDQIRSHSLHLQKNGKLCDTKQYIQHGTTTVFQHVHAVAAISLWLNRKLRLHANTDHLIRSSLLHDYFLYDWHDALHDHPRPHGFLHPKTAADNAHRDYHLHDRERDAILHHMFPLTRPPRHREGWIVTTADKISTYRELKLYWKQKIRSFRKKRKARI